MASSKILGVVGVNGDDLMLAAITRPAKIRGLHFNGRLPQPHAGPFWKVQAPVVLAEDRKHVHTFGIRRAEHLDDLPFLG